MGAKGCAVLVVAGMIVIAGVLVAVGVITGADVIGFGKAPDAAVPHALSTNITRIRISR